MKDQIIYFYEQDSTNPDGLQPESYRGRRRRISPSDLPLDLLRRSALSNRLTELLHCRKLQLLLNGGGETKRAWDEQRLAYTQWMLRAGSLLEQLARYLYIWSVKVQPNLPESLIKDLQQSWKDLAFETIYPERLWQTDEARLESSRRNFEREKRKLGGTGTGLKPREGKDEIRQSSKAPESGNEVLEVGRRVAQSVDIRGRRSITSRAVSRTSVISYDSFVKPSVVSAGSVTGTLTARSETTGTTTAHHWTTIQFKLSSMLCREKGWILESEEWKERERMDSLEHSLLWALKHLRATLRLIQAQSDLYTGQLSHYTCGQPLITLLHYYGEKELCGRGRVALSLPLHSSNIYDLLPPQPEMSLIDQSLDRGVSRKRTTAINSAAFSISLNGTGSGVCTNVGSSINGTRIDVPVSTDVNNSPTAAAAMELAAKSVKNFTAVRPSTAVARPFTTVARPSTAVRYTSRPSTAAANRPNSATRPSRAASSRPSTAAATGPFKAAATRPSMAAVNRPNSATRPFTMGPTVPAARPFTAAAADDRPTADESCGVRSERVKSEVRQRRQRRLYRVDTLNGSGSVVLYKTGRVAILTVNQPLSLPTHGSSTNSKAVKPVDQTLATSTHGSSTNSRAAKSNSSLGSSACGYLYAFTDQSQHSLLVLATPTGKIFCYHDNPRGALRFRACPEGGLAELMDQSEAVLQMWTWPFYNQDKRNGPIIVQLNANLQLRCADGIAELLFNSAERCCSFILSTNPTTTAEAESVYLQTQTIQFESQTALSLTRRKLSARQLNRKISSMASLRRKVLVNSLAMQRDVKPSAAVLEENEAVGEKDTEQGVRAFAEATDVTKVLDVSGKLSTADLAANVATTGPAAANELVAIAAAESNAAAVNHVEAAETAGLRSTDVGESEAAELGIATTEAAAVADEIKTVSAAVLSETPNKIAEYISESLPATISGEIQAVPTSLVLAAADLSKTSTSAAAVPKASVAQRNQDTDDDCLVRLSGEIRRLVSDWLKHYREAVLVNMIDICEEEPVMSKLLPQDIDDMQSSMISAYQKVREIRERRGLQTAMTDTQHNLLYSRTEPRPKTAGARLGSGTAESKNRPMTAGTKHRPVPGEIRIRPMTEDVTIQSTTDQPWAGVITSGGPIIDHIIPNSAVEAEPKAHHSKCSACAYRSLRHNNHTAWHTCGYDPDLVPALPAVLGSRWRLTINHNIAPPTQPMSNLDPQLLATPLVLCPALLRQLLSGRWPERACPHTTIPHITDIELDLLVGQALPRQQLVVVAVVESEGSCSTNSKHSSLIDMLEAVHKQMITNRVWPCFQSADDSFRLFLYAVSSESANQSTSFDQMTASANENTSFYHATRPVNGKTLMENRHNVKPGMLMIYRGGRLLYCSSTLNGYWRCTREDFEAELHRAAVLAEQHQSLPQDFFFSA